MVRRKAGTRKKQAPAAQEADLASLVAEEVKRQMPVVDCGVAVAVPNTIEEKMRAINTVAEALRSLAKAIDVSNLNVSISDCHVTNTGTGIRVAG